MKNSVRFMGAFAVLSAGTITLAGLAQPPSVPAAIPSPNVHPMQISLGESKPDIHRKIGQPDEIVLNGALGDETETYLTLGLIVSYHRSRVEVLTVRHMDALTSLRRSKRAVQGHQAVVTVSK